MPRLACKTPALYPRAIEDALNEDDHQDLVAALARGHDPNGKARSGEPLLMHAIRKFRHGGEAMLQALLERGADPNVRHGERTALMLTTMQSRPTLTALLIGAGAELDAVDEDGWTALMWASTRPSYLGAGCVEALVGAGANVNCISHTGSDALMLFAGKGNREAVACLLRAGADPCRRNSKKQRPADIALAVPHAYDSHKDCAKMLRDAEGRSDMAVDLDVLTPAPMATGRPRRM